MPRLPIAALLPLLARRGLILSPSVTYGTLLDHLLTACEAARTAGRGGDLARYYADLLGDFGGHPPARLLAQVHDDLAGSGWRVQAVGGKWAAAKDEPGVHLGVEDWSPYEGPRGGKGWKHASTGRVVYGARRPGGGRERLQGRTVDRQALAGQLAGYAGKEPASGGSARSAAALRRHHGQLALARVDELREELAGALGGKHNPKVADRLRKRLAELHHVFKHLGGHDNIPAALDALSGKTPRKENAGSVGAAVNALQAARAEKGPQTAREAANAVGTGPDVKERVPDAGSVGEALDELDAKGKEKGPGSAAELAGALEHRPAKPTEKEPEGRLIYPKDSLGVPRAQMPQIPSAHADEFLDDLHRKGVKTQPGEMRVGDLKPTQAELNLDQMETLGKKLPPEKLRSPVMVSSDHYILDGHHRWGELLRQDPDSTIQVNKVGLPIKELLAAANDFPKVTYKDAGATGKGLPPLSKVPPLREPTGPDDMDSWLQEAMAHPYVAEAERRLRDDAESKDTEIKWDKRPDGSWDPDRVAKVHEPVIAKFLNPKAKPKAGEKPKAVFLIGPFGAGKGTVGQPIVKKFMPDYTLINPDDIKQEMPEDEGYNATHIHEESSHIAKQIAARAKAAGHHLLFDGSGQNGAKMNKQASELASMGYDVHVIHVTVPAHTSAYRAAFRYLENPLGMADPKKKPSRYAPLGYVYHEVGSKPDATYELLKANPDVKSGKSFSSHGVKLGDPIPMKDSFER